MKNFDTFASRLSGDEAKVAGDERKLSRDEGNLDAFAAKLGQGPDTRLAQNDAGANAANPGDAATIRNALAPSMADFGGPQMGPPPPPPPNGGFSAPQNASGIYDSSGPVTKAPQNMSYDAPAPEAPGAAPPNYIANPGQYQDPNMGRPPAYMMNPGAPGAMASGGGSGGGPNLQAPIDAGNKAVLGTYDDQRSHMMQAAQQHAEATKILSGGHEAEARRQEIAIQRGEEQAEDAKQKNDAYLAKSDEMSAKLASGHIDPDRLYHNADTGTKVAMGIAAFLGALVPGVKQLSNTIFGNAHDDMEAQKLDYERQSKGLAHRDSVYGHMIKASGDAQLAGLQTRNALIDAAKLKLQAQAERLGIPEALSNAKIGVDVLNREQGKLQTEIAARAKAAAQAQAAAAAAARAHAEQTAWARSVQMAEMGLKKDELSIKRLEAENKGAEKAGTLDKDYATRILQKDVPEREAAIQRLKGQITDDKGIINEHKRIPGLSPFDNLKDTLLPSPGGFIDSTPGGHMVNQTFGLTPGERQNRQSWDRLKFQYRHDVTGAGGSDAEAAKIEAAFAGANSPEEQAAAVKLADSTIARIKNAAAQGDPSVIQRNDALNQMPAGARRVQ